MKFALPSDTEDAAQVARCILQSGLSLQEWTMLSDRDKFIFLESSKSLQRERAIETALCLFDPVSSMEQLDGGELKRSIILSQELDLKEYALRERHAVRSLGSEPVF